MQIGAIGPDKDCEAFRLAEKYMSEHYPEWIERYPAHLCDPERYFKFEGENAGKFSWNVNSSEKGLTDIEHIQDMLPENVLSELFK